MIKCLFIIPFDHSLKALRKTFDRILHLEGPEFINKKIRFRVSYLLCFIVFFLQTLSFAADNLNNGLVGYWQLNSVVNVSASIRSTPDTSPAANNPGIITSKIKTTPDGKFGQALLFDDSTLGNYLSTTNGFGSTKWSLSIWVKPDIAPNKPISNAAPFYGVFTIMSGDGFKNLIGIRNNGIYLYDYVNKIVSYDFVNNPGWHHIVVMYDGKKLIAVVDKLTKGYLEIANPLALSTQRLFAATSTSTNVSFKGVMDEIRLYNRVLTSTEIVALYDPNNLTVAKPIILTRSYPPAQLPSWSKYTHIAVNADRRVLCRASNTPGVSFEDMPFGFITVPMMRQKMEVPEIKAGESYSYYVRCEDRNDGYQNPTDLRVDFSVEPDTTAPEIRELEVSAIRQTTAEIVWMTIEAASSRVEYSIQGDSNIMVSEDALLTIPHAQLLTGLKPNTTYSYRVISKDKFNNAATSSLRTFTTQGAPFATTYFVSTNGKDSNDGSINAPASLDKALLLIKALKEKGLLTKGGVQVLMDGGVYYRSTPLVIDSSMSGTSEAPIVFKPLANKEVRISGGIKVSGFSPVVNTSVNARLADVAKDKVLQVSLKDKGITNYGILERSGVGKPGGGDVAFLNSHAMQFFFNDKPMTLARYPNNGYLFIDSLDSIAKSYIVQDSQNRPSKFISNLPSDSWVYGLSCTPFRDSFEKVSKVEALAAGKYRISIVDPGPNCGYEEGSPFFYLNMLEELDSPGEWYLDRPNGILYFWPPDDISLGKAYVSLTSSLVRILGASHIKFSHIIFEYARDAAIEINNQVNPTTKQVIAVAQGNMIERSIIRNSSIGAMIYGHNNGIFGGEIYNIDDEGVMLNGGDDFKLTSGYNYVVGNKIFDYGLRNKMYRPAVNMSGGYINNQQTGGVGNRARHNEIFNAPHNAILAQGNNFIVDYNKIYDVTRECLDCGAIYSWYHWEQRGTVYRYNIIKNTKDTVVGRLGTGGLHTVGLYLDMDNDEQIVYGNIFDNNDVSILFNGGRDTRIDNNIFLNSKEPLHLRAAALDFASSAMRIPIVDVSNTSPMIVTTLRVHNLGKYSPISTGKLEEVEGEPAANGNALPITRLNELQIRLDGSVPKGKYITGGYFSTSQTFYVRMDKYNYLNPPYSTYYPSLTRRKLEIDDGRPKGNSIQNNLFFKNAIQNVKDMFRDDEVGKYTFPKGNISTIDPLFENLIQGDYRFKPNSPVLAQGFNTIPVDQIGLLPLDENSVDPIPSVVGDVPLNNRLTLYDSVLVERYVKGFQLTSEQLSRANVDTTNSTVNSADAKLIAQHVMNGTVPN